MQAGDIFRKKNFVFRDGEVGEKLIVLLNDPNDSEMALFLKTTSQQKNKPLTKGCMHNLQLFLIPAGTSFFKLNTWVQLDDIYEFIANRFREDQDVSFQGSLSGGIIKTIIDCLLISLKDDMMPIHQDILCPPLERGMLKLQEKFSKK